ncbi:LytTR family DNA-binding domain-containing protein [Pontimicrobium sp. SW4]|uniref:LytTR family DNA-binding domain-containing protein n=1 Tax=Pontimicrobium sp. SW4 TaxID=3153519 RepID=A0AAU7BUI9_9FLAO
MQNTSKIITIIIEDDIRAQEYLINILRNHFSTIDIIGVSPSIKKSVELINRLKPELIFMDIELTDGSSFAIFNQLNYHDFEVIFVTAFDNYIQKAIDHYAFSFITKPIDNVKLVAAVQHYLNLKERLYTQSKFEHFSKFLDQKNTRLLIHIGSEHISIKIEELIKCEAEGNYTQFYMKNGDTHLASNPLKYYEFLLIEKGFFKAHRSVIININWIKSIYKKESIVLENNDKIQVSVRNKSHLSDLINSIS